MKRRDFIAAMSGLPYLAMPRRKKMAKTQANEGLVETPEKRLNYTWRLLNELCTDIGPRPTGSVGFERGARIIKNEMELSLPIVEYDRYEFTGWELVEESKFNMGGQYIETCPTYGGKGTSPEGISGVLQKRDGGFALADDSTGKMKAKINANRYGRAITHYQDYTNSDMLPSFGVGKQDVPLLERGVREKLPTHLTAWTRRIPKASGMNIVGKLPGKRKDEILFVAHADTVYNSPGANDNTASVVVMLMLAHAAAQYEFNHTLSFVASDGEEFGLKGAKHYGQKRIANGTMDNIRYVINFDSLTWGPDLHISSKQPEVKEIIRSIHQDLKMNTDPKFNNSDGFVLDSEPFSTSGAMSMHINSRGYNEKTLPVYHRPEDIASNVPLNCTENGFRIFNEFIKRVDEL